MSDQDKELIITEIRQTIQELRDLATLPVVAQEAQRIIHDSNSKMSDLLEIVETDMALSARVLRIANSAYYGVSRKIDNLKMALVILGMNEINNLVMTVSIMGIFQNNDNDGSLDLSKFWKHSAVCAELTAGLFEGMRRTRPSSAYTAGLMHDMGKLVLAQNFNDYFKRCKQLAKNDKISLAEAELKTIGIDHGHVGAWLTKRWNLPDDINNAIAQHHFRPSDSPRFGLPTFIYWADKLYYLIQDNPPEKVAQMLDKNPEWADWKGEYGYPTDRLINSLVKRIEKSLRLLQIIH